MKIFCKVVSDRGLNRIYDALMKYVPVSVQLVDTPDDADMVVMHIFGRRNHNLLRAQQILESGRSYAVIHYVLGSCRNPNPEDWMELWEGAKVVWSYYDLPTTKLYRAPLAANPNVFYPMGMEKKYIVEAMGTDYPVECYGEARLAALHVKRRVAHISQPLFYDPNVDYFTNITDDELREVYNQCSWVLALRRKDGFELPAVEALMCGVRPIVFDTPNYRHWYDGFAEFVPEVQPSELVAALIEVFKKEPAPVTANEREEICRRFDWKTIIERFWALCQEEDIPTCRDDNEGYYDARED